MLIFAKGDNIMSFSRNTLEKAIKNLASKKKIYSNESQFQFDLAWELRKQGFDVELEMLSVSQAYAKQLSKDERQKAYTDIVVKDETGYIVIELKYKTPETDDMMYYNVNNEKIYLFPQGAENKGSYSYWKDVERLEKLVNGTIPLNFDKNKKVVRGYAVLLTNAKKYWDSKAHNNFSTSLACELYPIEMTYVNNKVLCYRVAFDKRGKRLRRGENAAWFDSIDTQSKAQKYYPKGDDAKAYYPIEIKGNYVCKWDTYLKGLTCKLLNSKIEPKADEFKCLILEINK